MAPGHWSAASIRRHLLGHRRFPTRPPTRPGWKALPAITSLLQVEYSTRHSWPSMKGCRWRARDPFHSACYALFDDHFRRHKCLQRGQTEWLHLAMKNYRFLYPTPPPASMRQDGGPEAVWKVKVRPVLGGGGVLYQFMSLFLILSPLSGFWEKFNFFYLCWQRKEECQMSDKSPDVTENNKNGVCVCVKGHCLKWENLESEAWLI